MLEPQRSGGAYSTVIHGVWTSFGDISLLKVVQLFHQLLTEGESKDRKREHTRRYKKREHCLVYLDNDTCGLTNLTATFSTLMKSKILKLCFTQKDAQEVSLSVTLFFIR